MNNLANQKAIPLCNKHSSSADKWRYTLYTTFLLLVLFNPYTYKVMNGILSNVIGVIATKEGCPLPLGFAIHAVVFTILLRLLMDMNV